MHHIFISLMENEDKKISGLAVIRTNERGHILKTFAGEVTEKRDFEKLCDDVYRELVCNHDESYVVITETQETADYFKRNKITLFEAPWLYLSQLSWPLVYSDMIPGRALEQIAQHFNLHNQAPGTVTGHVEFLGRTYFAMMRSMRLALVAEEGMRDYGGKIIANVRAVLGF